MSSYLRITIIKKDWLAKNILNINIIKTLSIIFIK